MGYDWLIEWLVAALRRAGELRHGGAVGSGGCVRIAAGLRSVPAGLSAWSAVRVSRHVSSVQQDPVPVSHALHLLQAAEWRVAAAQLWRLRRDDSARRQHTASRPRPTRHQHMGTTRQRRTASLSRSTVNYSTLSLKNDPTLKRYSSKMCGSFEYFCQLYRQNRSL